MIKHGEKNKIKDLYSPFRYEEMPETADRIDGRTAVSDVILHRNGNYRSFIFFFLSFFIIYLTVKQFLTDFFFFFFFTKNLSLSLSPVLIQNGSLNPQAPGEGEISLPHSRVIFSKLKNEDKDLFSFRNCKKWCKKAQNAIISLSFPSYVNWQPPENRHFIGERARREVARRGFWSPQAVVMNECGSVSFCHRLITYFQCLRHYCRISAQMKHGKW